MTPGRADDWTEAPRAPAGARGRAGQEGDEIGWWRQWRRARGRRGGPGDPGSVRRAPLPERRPRLAFLFAVLPAVMIPALLLTGPVVYRADQAIDEIFRTPVAVAVQGPTDPAEPEATPHPLPDWDRKERVNIVLIGVDKREDDEFSRTDTIILVTIDPVAKKVGVLSLPRDLKVTIPGYGEDKINAAYVRGEMDKRPGGGVGLLQRTIARNFDVPVHYYAQVDFGGFVKIVDTFGGVNVDVPYPIKDDEYPTETYGYTGLYFAAGLQHLDGRSALRYARTRHDDGDFARARRQQEVLLSLRQQALTRDLPSRFPRLLDILAGSVQTDLSPTQAAGLVRLGQEIPRENIKTYSLQDLVLGEQEPGGPEYLIADWPKVRRLMREMIPDPPAAAVAPAPDPGVRIAVRNGTRRDRFATRSVATLRSAGFAGATVDETEQTLDLSVVYNYAGKGDQALLAARTLGLPEDAVRQAPGPAPSGVDILIVLGDDAPDRAPGLPASPTPRRP